jgi:hypothetical protein
MLAIQAESRGHPGARPTIFEGGIAMTPDTEGNYIVYSLFALISVGLLLSVLSGRSQDVDAFSSWVSVAYIVPRGRYHAGKNSLRTFVIALIVWSLLMAGLLYWISAR